MNPETKVIGGILGLTAAIIIGIVIIGGKSAPPPITAKKVDAGQTILATSHKLGSDDAKAKLVEFGDFQCPACGAAHPVLKQLKSQFGDKVQFVFRNYPLSTIHQNADNGSRAAEAADMQGKFWEMHDKLFENQNAWSNSTKAKDIFVTYAKDLGLDAEKFAKDFDSQAVIDRIAQDKGDGDALGVDATPTFFLNGVKYNGQTTVDALSSALQAELNK